MKNFLSKIVTGPPEAKTAAGGLTGVAISFVLGIVQFYDPSFKSPPAALVAMGITLATAGVSYLAPHTPRAIQPPPQAPAQTLSITAGTVQLSTGKVATGPSSPGGVIP